MVNRKRFASTKRFLAPAAVLVLVVAAFLAASPAAAQTATATLDVVAVDGAGGPLPGVTVEVKRPETGLTRTGVTGGAGIASVRRAAARHVRRRREALGLRDRRAEGHRPPRRPERAGQRDAAGQEERDGERRRDGAARGRLQDGLLDERHAGADPGPPDAGPRLPEAGLHRARRRARARRIPLRVGGPGHRRRRQREPVHDPRGRRRLHGPRSRPREDEVLAGRDLRVPRRDEPLRRRGGRLLGRRALDPDEDRHEHVCRVALRLLPRRLAARQGRPRAGLERQLRARPVRRSRWAARSSRIRRTSSRPSSRSTPRHRSSSGRRAPSSRSPPTSSTRSTSPSRTGASTRRCRIRTSSRRRSSTSGIARTISASAAWPTCRTGRS